MVPNQPAPRQPRQAGDYLVQRLLPQIRHQLPDHRLLPRVSYLKLSIRIEQELSALKSGGGGLFGLPKKPEEAAKPAAAAGKHGRGFIFTAPNRTIASTYVRPLWRIVFSARSWCREAR